MTTATQETKRQVENKELKNVVILFAGDSGDGIQPVSYTHLTLPTNREV